MQARHGRTPLPGTHVWCHENQRRGARCPSVPGSVMSPPGLSRRTVGLIVVLCAAVVGSVAWSLVQRAPSGPPVRRTQAHGAAPPRPVEPEILRVPPREMRALVREDALLRPDRRFVLAFEDVAALEGARPEGGAKVSSRDRRWTMNAWRPGGAVRHSRLLRDAGGAARRSSHARPRGRKEDRGL